MGDALSDKISNISISENNQTLLDDSSTSNCKTGSNTNTLNSKKSVNMTNSLSKYQLLKKKKEELEKKLNEKYNQLQQVCREEAQIIGVYPADFGSIDSNTSTQTLRRKVGTSFKLPENLLGNSEDDINKLMLEKQIQQQICEASLRLASDATISKAVHKAHKQTYEVAQQKLLAINQNLSKLKKLQAQGQMIAIKQTQDDINIHKKSPGVVGTSKILYSSNRIPAALDRRNAARSNSVTNSPSTAHKQQPFNTPQPRTRHDSFGTRHEYEQGKLSPISPSMTYHTYNQQYQQQLAQHFNPPALHYHYPINVGSSATMSGYHQNVNKKSPGQSTGHGRHHYHHNTIQLPPTIRQLSSSPQHRHVGQVFDANGNQYVETNQSVYHKPVSPTPITPISSIMRNNENSLVDRIESVQQAPGGYWLSMANNERVWFPLDNRFASLDRRNNSSKKLQAQSTKAVSTGNIDLSADDTEARRREKTWRETSLDEPISVTPKNSPTPLSSPTPPLPAKKQNLHYDPFPPHIMIDIQNANIPPPKLLSRAPSVVPSINMHVSHDYNQMDNGNIRPHPKLTRQEIPITEQQPYSIPTRTPEHLNERPNSVMLHPIHRVHSTTVSPTNSLFSSPTVSIQSPLLNDSPNVTIVQEGKIQPYREEEKPFEMSDFYKYSTKFRQKQMATNSPNKAD